MNMQFTLMPSTHIYKVGVDIVMLVTLHRSEVAPGVVNCDWRRGKQD